MMNSHSTAKSAHCLEFGYWMNHFELLCQKPDLLPLLAHQLMANYFFPWHFPKHLLAKLG